MTERIKAKDFRGGLFAGGKKGPQSIEPKEALISKAVEDLLNLCGIYNDRLNAGQFERITTYADKKTGAKKEFRRWIRLCRKGTPDRYAVLPAKWDPDGRGGKLLMLEIKTASGRLNEEQKAIHRLLRAAGAIVLVTRSVADLAEFLDECKEKSARSREHIHAHANGSSGDSPSIA